MLCGIEMKAVVFNVVTEEDKYASHFLSLSLETYFTAIMDLSVNSWRM
jgi:hypothetical protein